MSDFCITIELPPYLAQWYIHENGGVQPIALPRLSVEKRILELFLMKRPANVDGTDDTDGSRCGVSVIIPKFKYKPADKFNYLPRAARNEFADCVRNRFLVRFWRDIHSPANIGRRKDQLFEAWMIANGIEFNDTNWNALAKIYQRLVNNYRARRFRANRATAKKSS